MPTLADMKARIVSETMRPDLDIAIGNEIASAIRFYQAKRFWFNEKQTTVTLSTTSGESVYGPPPSNIVENLALASAYLPSIIRLDSLSIMDNGGLRQIHPTSEFELKRMTANPSDRGAPRWFSYYGQFLTLYPVPDGTYTLLVAGLIRAAAPLTDMEENNPWMNEAEELIRSRAKSRLYANSMLDPQMAQAMAVLEAEALLGMQQETSARTQVDRIIADECI